MRTTAYILFILGSMLWGQESLQFGAPLTLDQSIPISTIMNTPEDFVGKKVQVSGVIVDVCSHLGCWIDLASDKHNQTIRIKVEDGEITFPVAIRGKRARVEGTVEVLHYTEEEFLGMKKHEAEEKGIEFDSTAFHYTPEDARVYQIRGLGAIVE